MSAGYLVRPKAHRDLDDQAYYLAKDSTPETGHRFLVAAHETFALLATQPEMGWRSRRNYSGLASLRVFRVSDFENVLILYRPLADGVDILRVVHSSRNLRALLRHEGTE